MISIKSNLWIILFLLLHLFGLIGIAFEPTRSIFLLFTPVNLLFTFFILTEFGIEKEKKAYWAISLIAILGFLFEVIGVNTSLLFGSYIYDQSLGFKIFNTPVIIALNWVVVAFSSYAIADKLLSKSMLTVFFSTFLMVFIDVFIEPICFKLDFWHWKENVVPLKNFRDWFIISLLFSFLIHLFKLKLNIKICYLVYLTELLFFILLNVMI